MNIFHLQYAVESFTVINDVFEDGQRVEGENDRFFYFYIEFVDACQGFYFNSVIVSLLNVEQRELENPVVICILLFVLIEHKYLIVVN
jgi:hypothetical protein